MISGQFPLVNGAIPTCGRLGSELTVAEGRDAARVAALNALAQVGVLLGGFDDLVGILRLDGIVASTEDFHDHASVLDGASIAINEFLGERGCHSRFLIPVHVLPFRSEEHTSDLQSLMRHSSAV